MRFQWNVGVNTTSGSTRTSTSTSTRISTSTCSRHCVGLGVFVSVVTLLSCKDLLIKAHALT